MGTASFKCEYTHSSWLSLWELSYSIQRQLVQTMGGGQGQQSNPFTCPICSDIGMKGHFQSISVSWVSSTNKPTDPQLGHCAPTLGRRKPALLSLPQTDERLTEGPVEFHCPGVYSWSPSTSTETLAARGLVLMPGTTHILKT